MYYSKSKLNSLYGKMVHVIFGRKGYGKSYYEELKAKKNKSKLFRRKDIKESKYSFIGMYKEVK